MTYTFKYQSPLGRIMLASNGEALTGLWFYGQKYFGDTLPEKYEEKELGEFYGVYYGQIGVRVKPDTMRYLTNDTIENCTTYNFETSKTRKSI